MTDVQEYREAVVETPQGPGRSKTFRILAIMIAAIAAIGFGWLAFGDSGDEAPIEDPIVSETANSTDEALVGTNVEFPFGRFENRDAGFRVLVVHEDGTYTFNVHGNAVNGAYEVDGDVFTFLTDDTDRQADSGTYHWTYEDGNLKFNAIEDGHRYRSAFITYRWVLTE
jgi:hypothetical protein